MATADMSQFGNESGILQMQAVNDSGYDKNADSREAPEVRINKIFARQGSIVIQGRENDKETEKAITIDEAVLRSRALLDMVKVPWKYKSDLKETRRILQMFVKAIDDANNQLAAAGFSNGLRI